MRSIVSATVAILLVLAFVLPGTIVTPVAAVELTGTIIIHKITAPASTTSFGFTDNITAPNSFNLTHGNNITFSDVPPGTYVVTEDDPGPLYAIGMMGCSDPDGGTWLDVPTRTVTIDLDPGETVECTFRNDLQTGTITAHKFNDRNANGVQDAGEEDLDGWLMTLNAGFGCGGFELASGMTDSNGNVIFSNLEAGNYSVQELPLLGWQNTTPVCQNVTLLPGGSEIVSFGNQEVICVAVDVKPRSCPNSLNVDSKGVLPVAILGSDDFDVTQVDPVTVMLEGVAPLRWALKDVAGPECSESDGYVDLTLKFKTQEIVAALGAVSDGDVLSLMLMGNLKNDFGSMPIAGDDDVVILKKE